MPLPFAEPELPVGHRPDLALAGGVSASGMRTAVGWAVVAWLDEHLSPHLYYHNSCHTLSVAEEARKLGGVEGLSPDQQWILDLAAFFHDTGWVEGASEHEICGAGIAARWMARADYSAEQIQQVREAILATRFPHAPRTRLEEILCDADLAHVGSPHYALWTDLLRRELSMQGVIQDEASWLKFQIRFLEKHHYFTSYAIEHWEPVKQAHLQEIKSYESRANA